MMDDEKTGKPEIDAVYLTARRERKKTGQGISALQGVQRDKS